MLKGDLIFTENSNNEKRKKKTLGSATEHSSKDDELKTLKSAIEISFNKILFISQQISSSLSSLHTA